MRSRWGILSCLSNPPSAVCTIQKQALRQYIRIQKGQHTARLLSAMSEDICSRVLRSAVWQDASVLLLYYPLKDEVDVRPLIRESYEAGKRVLLPVCCGD